MASWNEFRLLAFLIVGSAKLADVVADGRYALHAHQDPNEPHEFLVPGRAREVDDPAVRAGPRAGHSSVEFAIPPVGSPRQRTARARATMASTTSVFASA